ncbi:MAG: hypothetical protein H0X34_02845 [Chthoniobacterales bacterium]|nr:hypothetical protein [Chthoniobacterales bacterium]
MGKLDSRMKPEPAGGSENDGDKDRLAPGAIPGREHDRKDKEDGEKQFRSAKIIRHQDDR